MACRFRGWAGLLGLAAIALSSCQFDMPLDVRQLDDGQISIEVKPDLTSSPCFNWVSISHQSGEETVDDWYVNLDVPDTDPASNKSFDNICLARVVFPHAPPNYHYSIGSEKVELTPGREYIIQAGGAGFTSQSTMVRKIRGH